MKKQQPTYRSLREWRDALDLTQEAAAARLGVEQSSYSRFENRARAPRPRMAKAISQKTGVPLESVLGL